ncbi:MAG: hypothetical protein MZU95_10660 [Desulfomicrobium escambiense]|nr:hypothetical protein [Desulfomicrobium escambiense]
MVCFFEDAGAWSYALHRVDCSDPTHRLPDLATRSAAAGPTPIDSVLTFPAGITSVFFDTLGRPDPDGVDISISSGGKTSLLRVESSTGFVHVL